MFEVPNEVFQLYYEAVDAMIDTNFGVQCSVVYPAEKTECPNCIFNPFQSVSSNKYKSGGPVPFEGVICPYCNGQGFLYDSTSENIKLRCYFDKKSFPKIPTNLNVNDIAMASYGHIVDMPKCQRADYITVNNEQSGYGMFKYKLFGSPVLHGFKKNKYFIAYWRLFE